MLLALDWCQNKRQANLCVVSSAVYPLSGQLSPENRIDECRNTNGWRVSEFPWIALNCPSKRFNCDLTATKTRALCNFDIRLVTKWRLSQRRLRHFGGRPTALFPNGPTGYHTVMQLHLIGTAIYCNLETQHFALSLMVWWFGSIILQSKLWAHSFCGVAKLGDLAHLLFYSIKKQH